MRHRALDVGRISLYAVAISNKGKFLAVQTSNCLFYYLSACNFKGLTASTRVMRVAYYKRAWDCVFPIYAHSKSNVKYFHRTILAGSDADQSATAQSRCFVVHFTRLLNIGINNSHTSGLSSANVTALTGGNSV